MQSRADLGEPASGFARRIGARFYASTNSRAQKAVFAVTNYYFCQVYSTEVVEIVISPQIGRNAARIPQG